MFKNYLVLIFMFIHSLKKGYRNEIQQHKLKNNFTMY